MSKGVVDTELGPWHRVARCLHFGKRTEDRDWRRQNGFLCLRLVRSRSLGKQPLRKLRETGCLYFVFGNLARFPSEDSLL